MTRISCIFGYKLIPVSHDISTATTKYTKSYHFTNPPLCHIYLTYMYFPLHSLLQLERTLFPSLGSVCIVYLPTYLHTYLPTLRAPTINSNCLIFFPGGFFFFSPLPLLSHSRSEHHLYQIFIEFLFFTLKSRIRVPLSKGYSTTFELKRELREKKKQLEPSPEEGKQVSCRHRLLQTHTPASLTRASRIAKLVYWTPVWAPVQLRRLPPFRDNQEGNKK
ncbi:hypothetical protein F4809DRAFT_592552 [Biscogniauxia mediterranea]|nr:hypothetical protein F4809DRAFT_592552 [Biscogniauxia mediterranea]